MGMPDIRSLVPHAGPMVLLDRVISVDEDSLLAEVRIRSDSLFCNTDGVGAWVGIEYMAQAIGAWACSALVIAMCAAGPPNPCCCTLAPVPGRGPPWSLPGGRRFPPRSAPGGLCGLVASRIISWGR